MDIARANELASCVVSGVPMTSSEEQELMQWLVQRPDARDGLLEDEAMDSLLRCVGRLEGTEDEFVQAALRRAAQ